MGGTTDDILWFIGIDPQPFMFAVHILSKDDSTKDWFQILLEKKSRMPDAQAWQSYIWQQSVKLIEKCLVICNSAKNMCICIEQQRGRVNSIIEQSLLAACILYNIRVKITHPQTWKKDFVEFKQCKNHRSNKQVAEDMVKSRLLNYCEIYKYQLPTSNRIHDLCDAYLISVFLKKMYISNTMTKHE